MHRHCKFNQVFVLVVHPCGAIKASVLPRVCIKIYRPQSMLELSEIGNTSEWNAGESKGRTSKRAPVAIEIVLDSSAGGRSTRISDLSVGGCFVETINTYRPGETISFDLKDTNQVALKFNGVVAYSLDSIGFGLKFTGLNEAHLQFLRRHIV